MPLRGNENVQTLEPRALKRAANRHALSHRFTNPRQIRNLVVDHQSIFEGFTSTRDQSIIFRFCRVTGTASRVRVARALKRKSMAAQNANQVSTLAFESRLAFNLPRAFSAG